MIELLIQRIRGGADTGALAIDWTFEGMPPGWMFAGIVAGVIVSWLGYRIGARSISAGRRGLLAVLRCLFFAGLVGLLAHPVANLTVYETVRGRLSVLVDDSASMGIQDRRTTPLDVQRARLVCGSKSGAAMPSRTEIVRALGSSPELQLWQRLEKVAHLDFSFFSDHTNPAGPLSPDASGDTSASAREILTRLESKGQATAIGDAILAALDPSNGSPPANLFLITDGASNTGASVQEAAEAAKQRGIPIHVYGVGIEEPDDIMVRGLAGPAGVFEKEQVAFDVKIRAPSKSGSKVKLFLFENDRLVAEREISIPNTAENTFQISYEPQESGSFQLKAVVAPQAGETTDLNNSAATRLRVLNKKVRVLYVEQEPRWEFRYLLATLARDRRLHVDCLLYDGDPVVQGPEGRPFIDRFPESRAELATYSVIILGDVAPESLGVSRMDDIRRWVGDLGGAVIFLAGRKSNPWRYASTPLETILPVEIDATLSEDEWKKSLDDPGRLLPTAAGSDSPLLRLATDGAENKRVWSELPDVDWTARVLAARPSAEVLVEDPKHLGTDGPVPIIAKMNYGSGVVLYIGTDETYRWRSRRGEKYHAAFWSSIIQGFALDRELAASPRIQMKPAKNEFSVGEKVRLRGQILDADFEPCRLATLSSTLSVRPTDGSPLPPKPIEVRMVEDNPGVYEAEIDTPVAGSYSLAFESEPEATIDFWVTEKSPEMEDTALDLAGLRRLAGYSGGIFFREEDLDKVPDLVKSTAETFPVISRFDPTRTAWWLPLLLGLVFLEWILRRLWNLK